MFGSTKGRDFNEDEEKRDLLIKSIFDIHKGR